MKPIIRAALISAFVLAVSIAMARPPSAAALMEAAQKQAKAGKKNVLVIFHASWCGWCKKFDAFLEDPKMGKLMKDNYVIVHLDVMEQPDKKDLENEGGEVLMAKWGGAKAGLPFSVVLDADGKMLTSSLTDPKKESSNIGYPAATEEIAHFVKMLKGTAPRLKDKQRGEIEAWLKANAPKG